MGLILGGDDRHAYGWWWSSCIRVVMIVMHTGGDDRHAYGWWWSSCIRVVMIVMHTGGDDRHAYGWWWSSCIRVVMIVMHTGGDDRHAYGRWWSSCIREVMIVMHTGGDDRHANGRWECFILAATIFGGYGLFNTPTFPAIRNSWFPKNRHVQSVSLFQKIDIKITTLSWQVWNHSWGMAKVTTTDSEAAFFHSKHRNNYEQARASLAS